MNTQSKALTRTGWGLAVPIALLLTFSASMKLQNSAEFSEQFTGHMGYPANAAVVQIIFPGELQILDLAPFARTPVRVRFEIPLRAERIDRPAR